MNLHADSCFELWRQDDNGGRFLVGRYPTRDRAERRLAELSRALQKQTYWVTDNRQTYGHRNA